MKKVFSAIFKYGIISLYIIFTLYLCLCAIKTADESGEQSNVMADFVDSLSNTDKIVKPESVSLMRIDNGVKRWIKINYKVGDVVNLVAIYYPQSTTYTATKWEVDNPQIATINSEGKITFLSEGEVTVTLTNKKYESVTFSHTFNISPVETTGVKFKNMLNGYLTVDGEDTGELAKIYKGDKILLEGSVTPSNATNKEIDYSVNGCGEILDEIIDGKTYKILNVYDSGSMVVTVFQGNKTFSKQFNVLDTQGVMDDFVLKNRVMENFEENLTLSVGASIYIFPICNENFTRNFTFTSSNQDVVSVVYGRAQIRNVGNSTITVKDEISGITKTINITAKNKYGIEKIHAYGLDKTTIENGQTATLGKHQSATIYIQHVENASYKIATYSSSNERIATIDKNGVITTKNVGKTVITATICDNLADSKTVTFSFTLKVTKQTFSDVILDYYNVFRKAVGHFLAYVFLGVLSGITYSYIKNRKLKIILHFSFGVFIVSITEILQKFTSGRASAFKDVLLNASGFLIGTILITAVFVIIYFIKKKKTKK